MSARQTTSKSTSHKFFLYPTINIQEKSSESSRKIDGHSNISLKFSATLVPIFTTHKKCFDIPKKTTNLYSSNKFQCDNIIK